MTEEGRKKILFHLEAGIELIKPHLAQTPHRIAVDGGAHHGLFSALLMPYINRIYAFEPHEDSWPYLWELPERHVSVFHCALGEEECQVSLANPEASSRSYYYTKDATSGSMMFPLDSFNLKDIDLIKLNIEGAELPALRGAKKTIEQTHPLIYVEMKGYGKRFGYQDEELQEFLTTAGYRHVGKQKHMHLYKWG